MKIETGNRIAFDYSVWKEKGGKVYWLGQEVSGLTPLQGGKWYAGFTDDNPHLFIASDLTMSAPDRVEYFNVYDTNTSKSYKTIQECKDGNLVMPIHILEVNHTTGTNKIVHRYNTDKDV